MRMLLALSLLIAVPLHAQEQSYSEFAEFLETFQKDQGIPALSAVIVHEGKTAWQSTWGTSDDEGAIPATPGTVFSIASVTKPVVATALLAEAAAGSLDLNTPLTADADFQGFCDWLVTTGIPFGGGGREADGSDVPAADCSTPLTLTDALNMRVNENRDQGFTYNPMVYARIDRVTEGAGARPLRQIVRQRVIAPSGMKDTALGWHDPGGGAALRKLAPPFRITDGRREKAVFPDDDFRAAAGIYTSAIELAKFDIALDAGALLPPEWQQRIMSADHLESDYAFGWFRQTWNGQQLMWHSGWEPGAYSALYLKVPGRNITLIALANTEALWWGNSLVRAEVEHSPVAAKFLELFAQ